jgi:release factor glutamine methyltransferase
MTGKELYQDLLMQLQEIYSAGEASVIADRVFESFAGIKRIDLLKDPGRQLNDAVIQQLNTALQQLMKHRPLQYVLGEAWFYHLRFKVDERVLVPRPETEELVERLLADNGSLTPAPSILDIGTGSGCIPISIKKNMPGAMLTAIDLSEAALQVARENAASHQTAVNFMQMDFLDEQQWYCLPLSDIIISNPPYIPETEKTKLDKNVVAHEPHLALFVPDSDPLLFYKKIAAFAKVRLKRGGKIYVELHADLAQATAMIFRWGFTTVDIHKDMHGNERMLVVAS